MDQRRAFYIHALCLRNKRIWLSKRVVGMNIRTGQGSDSAGFRGGAADGYFCKP